MFIYIFVALRPNAGNGFLILEVSRSHTTTGWVISSSQRPLPDNTHHSQQTHIHDCGGIRTHNLSKRAAADLGLRPRGHWDLPSCIHKPFKCCTIHPDVSREKMAKLPNRPMMTNRQLPRLFSCRKQYILRSKVFRWWVWDCASHSCCVSLSAPTLFYTGCFKTYVTN
jgi:hypothetical protein